MATTPTAHDPRITAATEALYAASVALYEATDAARHAAGSNDQLRLLNIARHALDAALANRFAASRDYSSLPAWQADEFRDEARGQVAFELRETLRLASAAVEDWPLELRGFYAIPVSTGPQR